MSQREKALKRLAARPTDYTWKELVSLLKRLGFQMYASDGSRTKFHRERDDATLDLHRPHQPSILKAYMLEQIVQRLKEYGDIDA